MWVMIKYPHNDTTWFNKVRKVNQTLSRIEGCLLSKQFCDQAGWPLAVGDMTNRGKIKEIIDRDYAITEQGKIHWSYLKKC